MNGEIRKKEILEAAMRVAEAFGYTHVSRSQVADEAGCSPATVNVYFDTMEGLRKAVMEHAVSSRNVKVLAQGLIAQDPIALGIPGTVKRKVLAAI